MKISAKICLFTASLTMSYCSNPTVATVGKGVAAKHNAGSGPGVPGQKVSGDLKTGQEGTIAAGSSAVNAGGNGSSPIDGGANAGVNGGGTPGVPCTDTASSVAAFGLKCVTDVTTGTTTGVIPKGGTTSATTTAGGTSGSSTTGGTTGSTGGTAGTTTVVPPTPSTTGSSTSGTTSGGSTGSTGGTAGTSTGLVNGGSTGSTGGFCGKNAGQSYLVALQACRNGNIQVAANSASTIPPAAKTTVTLAQCGASLAYYSIEFDILTGVVTNAPNGLPKDSDECFESGCLYFLTATAQDCTRID